MSNAKKKNAVVVAVNTAAIGAAIGACMMQGAEETVNRAGELFALIHPALGLPLAKRLEVVAAIPAPVPLKDRKKGIETSYGQRHATWCALLKREEIPAAVLAAKTMGELVDAKKKPKAEGGTAAPSPAQIDAFLKRLDAAGMQYLTGAVLAAALKK